MPEAVDASALRALPIGGKADLTYFEYVQSMTRASTAVASTAAPPIAPAQEQESVRDRLSLYALYGVDNQFSGKMIEAAPASSSASAK